MTGACVASTPSATTIKAGTFVASRRSQTWIVKRGPLRERAVSGA
jgi:hypothetical protein